MKTGERIALIYGASALGAAAVSYFRGRRGAELLIDTSLHGALVGTVVNGVVYYMTPAEAALTNGAVLAVPTRTNGAEEDEDYGDEDFGDADEAEDNPLFGHKDPHDYEGVGALPPKAIHVLEKVNAEQLYDPMKKSGVKVAAIPKDPNMVSQDPT